MVHRTDVDRQRRQNLADAAAGIASPWVPNPGVLVKDTSPGKIGTAVGWDGETGMVTLAPLDGGGGDRETAKYKPPNEVDRLWARMTRTRAGRL
ncbi:MULTISPECIES: hypothetical protein [Streptomyces]|uniref:hypothetical protein n=1 Tax=Streptomyces TaxID=1883 RepID=UPI00345C2B68